MGAVNAACFDISSACTGFVFALSTAHAYISSGLYKTALVVGADLLSKLVDWTDRSTCVLFGDGAGAAVVTAAESGIIGLNMHSNGAKGGVLTCGSRSTGNFLLGKKPELGYMTMEGQEVFKFAVKQVPECIKEVLEETGNTADDIDLFVIHQANYRIIESIAKRLKVDLEKFPVNMEHYGNTSGASVPILLDELNRAGKLKQGDINFNQKKENNIMLEKMKEIIADQLSVDADSITEASSFKEDLGADSLDLFELVMALEDEYSVEIPAEDLENLATVGDVMNYLKNKGVEA